MPSVSREEHERFARHESFEQPTPVAPELLHLERAIIAARMRGDKDYAKHLERELVMARAGLMTNTTKGI